MLVDLFTKWIITLFTVDFGVEIAYGVIDMLLVHGWRTIYGTILSLLTTAQHLIIGKPEDESIGIIKKFVREGNIDFEAFFTKADNYPILKKDLEDVGKKFANVKIPQATLYSLSSNASDFNLFSTYHKPVMSIDLRSQERTNEKDKIKAIEKRSNYTSPKVIKKHREPKKQEKVPQQLRLSSAVRYKPLDPGRSPLPIQMTSDEEMDHSAITKQNTVDPVKLRIPAEGNINKSPMSMFTKATRTNGFGASKVGQREKSYSNSTIKYADRKKAGSILTSHQNYESVQKPKARKSVAPHSNTKRASTMKTRSRHPEFHMVGGTCMLSKRPKDIGKIRQSLEINDKEMEGCNDTDERVTSHKKDILHRNIDWKNDSELKQIKFPIECDKNARFKEHMSSSKKSYRKGESHRSINSKTGVNSEQKISANKSINHTKSSHRKYEYANIALMHRSKNDSKRKNRKELNSFQENVEGLSSDNSPENLKITNDAKDKWNNNEVYKVLNNGKSAFSTKASRYSNPVFPNTTPTKMEEIEKITESPEYNNKKYINSRPNQFPKLDFENDEIDEYTLLESPEVGSKKQHRGLVVNASGSKKCFNRASESIGNTIRILRRPVFDEVCDRDLSLKLPLRNEGQMADNSLLNSSVQNYHDLSYQAKKFKKYNKTQRMEIDGLMTSPKNTLKLQDTISSRLEFPSQGVTKILSTGDEVHANMIPDARAKKRKANIAQDFETNNHQQVLKRQLSYENMEDEIPQRASIPFSINKDISGFKGRKKRLLTENNELESDDKSPAKKPQMMQVDQRVASTDLLDNLSGSQGKNTPLKSNSTRAKGTLSGLKNHSYEGHSKMKYNAMISRRNIYNLKNKVGSSEVFPVK